MSSGLAINGVKSGEVMMFDAEHILDTMIAVLLAVAGGLARLLNAKDKTKLKWSIIFSELFISRFAGIMTLLLARATGLTGDWVGIVCGIAGWTSPMLLYALARMVERVLKIEQDELKKNKSKKEK